MPIRTFLLPLQFISEKRRELRLEMAYFLEMENRRAKGLRRERHYYTYESQLKNVPVEQKIVFSILRALNFRFKKRFSTKKQPFVLLAAKIVLPLRSLCNSKG